MSSNDKDHLPTTINSLATELIIKIVRLSSPAPSWDNSVERFKHLRNLALVCRALRGPAQEELFRHVILPSLHAPQAFVAVVKSRAGARKFASIPRTLRAGPPTKKYNQTTYAIHYITKHCSRLESIWLLNTDGLDVVALTSGTAVKELFCDGCRFIPPKPNQKGTASPLVRLGITNCSGVSSLKSHFLPQVQSLDASRPVDNGSMYKLVNSLGGQLHSVCIDK
ncbi:hypothetical protein RQP46_005242 [Phenoliferia psychrophenolica]